MGQRGTNEVVLMEDGAVLYLALEVHQDGILYELSLEETLLVNGTVEYALVTEGPEEATGEVTQEEVLDEVPCEVGQLVPPEIHGVRLLVVLDLVPNSAVEEREEIVELLDDVVEDLGVFFAELLVLESAVGYGFSVH